MGNIMLGHCGVRGGSSAALTVIGTNAKEGSLVQANKDGKTYSRTFDSDKKAVFKNLTTGQWNVIVWGNEDQGMIENSIDIIADYSLTMAYFTATINVTYPAGSTCTCTNGSTVLNSTNDENTNGSCTFIVPNTGTWTVSCTNGTQTDSQNVEITEEGQTKTITLFYKIYLFNNGDQCSDLTGGWVSNGNDGYTYSNKSPAISIQDGMIKLYGTSNQNSAIGTNNTIDLAEYTKMYIDWEVLSSYSSTTSAAKLWAVPSKTIIASQAKVNHDSGAAGARRTDEISLASVNTSLYIALTCGGATNYKVNIYSIYLVK